MKFDFGKYKGQKVAMHCKTEQEAIDFCNYMHEHGKKWNNGEPYGLIINYNVYGSKTCYWFNAGKFGDKEWFIENDFEILEWSDYTDKFTKSDLKNGDVLINREGSVEIAIPEVGTRITKDGCRNNISSLREDLTNNIDTCFDIMKVYRPKSPEQCSFNENLFKQGELIFDRSKTEFIEITLEEIAALKGVSVDQIRIKN